MTGGRPKANHDPAEIERRLRNEAAREVPVADRWWPNPAQVAALLGRHRTQVWRIATARNLIEYRPGNDSRGPITLNPEDVLRMVDERRRTVPRKTGGRRARKPDHDASPGGGVPPSEVDGTPVTPPSGDQ